MLDLSGVPLHAALVHFPVAAGLFGLLATLAALPLAPPRRRPWLAGAALLLALAAVTGLLAAVTGRSWAEARGLLPDGGWLPASAVRSGLALRHALLGLAGTLLAALAALAAHRTRRSGKGLVLALFLALAAAGALLVGGHAGGVMVHVPQEAPAPR